MSSTLVQKQFGAAAADYAASAVHASGPSLGRLVALVSPQPHWHVLDVATGAGHTALAFAPLVASVVASDITGEMLAEASKLAAVRRLANVETTRAEAGNLPFPDASFDLVTCRLAAHHFPDPRYFRARSPARPEAGRHIRARRQRRPRCGAHAGREPGRAARCGHALQHL